MSEVKHYLDPDQWLRNQKRWEVLQTVVKGGRSFKWFTGLSESPDEGIAEATVYLRAHDYIEEVKAYPQHAPRPFHITAKGEKALQEIGEEMRNIAATISQNSLDRRGDIFREWKRREHPYFD